MDSKIIKFTDLNVWKEGHILVIMVYKETRNFPNSELYSLVDQLKRAAISITSNFAEGFGRKGYKEKIQFYYQASGSLAEVRNQLLIARDVGYINDRTYEQLETQAEIVSKLLFGIIKSSKKYLNSK